MAQLIVRDLEDDVKERLQRRAGTHGQSMEAEVRDILRAAVMEIAESSEPLGTRIAHRFKETGIDKPIEEIRDWKARIPNFGT